jgi:hypothetical protein
MDGLIEEGSEVVGQAIEGVANGGNNWAAIILLLGMLASLAVVGLLAWKFLQSRDNRADARESEAKAESARLLLQIKTDAEAREERQRQDYDRQIAMITDVLDHYDVRQKETNLVLGGVLESLRENTRTIAGFSVMMGKHSELLDRLVPHIEPTPLPKKRAPRKPQVSNE